MSYATKANLVDAFGESEILALTDRDGSGTIDETVLGRALTSASGEIDSYIAAIYDLPLPSVPDMVVSTCCDITRFKLYFGKAPEEVKERYDDAIRWLRDISKGVATLGLVSEDTTVVSVVVQSRAQIYSDALFDKMMIP